MVLKHDVATGNELRTSRRDPLNSKPAIQQKQLQQPPDSLQSVWKRSDDIYTLQQSRQDVFQLQRPWFRTCCSDIPEPAPQCHTSWPFPTIPPTQTKPSGNTGAITPPQLPKEQLSQEGKETQGETPPMSRTHPTSDFAEALSHWRGITSIICDENQAYHTGARSSL